MATLTSAQIEWLQTLGEIVGHGSAVHAAVGSGPGGGSRHTADKSKHLKGQVSEGDPTLVVVRKIPLGETRWRDHKGTLLGYTTAEGALVTKAPSPAWKKMAVCNLFGRRSVIAMADAETLDRRWRDALRDVQAGIPRGQALLVRVKQAADAISERKKNDPKFQQAVNQYFRQVDELRALSEGINKADAHYAETLHRLESTILGTEIEATVDQVNAIKEQEGDVEKDRVRAKQIFGQVLSLGTAIAGAGPFSAAAAISMVAKAADLIGNALIDGVYDKQIQQLEAKLHEAKGQLKELKSKKFHEDIAAAQEVVSQAISDCRSAAAVFVAALKDVGRSRAAAADASSSSKNDPTRIVAEAIGLQTQQHHALDTFTGAAEAFNRLSSGIEVGIRKLRDMHAYVSDWIVEVASADARLEPGTPWARQTELAGRSNAVELGQWIAFAPGAREACRQALVAMSGQAATAAMASYDEAMQTIEQALATQAPSTRPMADANFRR